MWGGGVNQVYHGSTKVYEKINQIKIYKIGNYNFSPYAYDVFSFGLPTSPNKYITYDDSKQQNGYSPTILTSITGTIGAAQSTIGYTLRGSGPITATYSKTITDCNGLLFHYYQSNGFLYEHGVCVSSNQQINDNIPRLIGVINESNTTIRVLTGIVGSSPSYANVTINTTPKEVGSYFYRP